MKYSIAIDLGGTIVKIGLLRQGEILEVNRIDAHLSQGLRNNLPRIQEVIDALLARYQLSSSQLSGVGLAFAGLVNPVESKVISTNKKYDDACGLDLKAWVQEHWNVPFYMDNDARLATVGEWYRGAASGQNNVVMMTIGTGIGTGVIMDGKVLYGQHFQAGSLGGHFVVDYKGRKCNCGNIGCVEALASSFFLSDIIQEHPELSDKFKKEAAGYDFKDIFLLAGQGNADALLLRNECMDVWAAAVITCIHAYDPEIIVLGGGIAKSKDVIIPYIKKKVEELAWCPSGKVILTCALLGDGAALIGLDYFLQKQII
jgi:glucokinase